MNNWYMKYLCEPINEIRSDLQKVKEVYEQLEGGTYFTAKDKKDFAYLLCEKEGIFYSDLIFYDCYISKS